jgi:hypothetical protein
MASVSPLEKEEEEGRVGEEAQREAEDPDLRVVREEEGGEEGEGPAVVLGVVEALAQELGRAHRRIARRPRALGDEGVKRSGSAAHAHGDGPEDHH